MNNDLISREALKKKIEEVQYTQEFCIEHKIDYSVSMQMLGMVIDNAQPVDRPQGDLISREALKRALEVTQYNDIDDLTRTERLIDNASTVESDKELYEKIETYKNSYRIMSDAFENEVRKNRSRDEWIPVKYRPLTGEERIAFAEHYGIEYCDTVDEKAFDCPMPEDGQEILISTSWGVVEDEADNDIDGEGFIVYGLKGNGDWEGIDAWMPKPEPYKEADNEHL